METKAQSINKVAIFNMLGPIVLNGLAFFTMPVFTRLLGAEGYGQYTNYASFLGLLAAVVGFQAAGAIAPASVRFTQEERDRVFSNIITAALFSAVIIGGLIGLFIGPISRFTELPTHLVAILFLHATGQFIVNFSTAKYSYDKRSTRTFFVSVTLSVISIGLSLLFIYFIPSVERYMSYIYGHTIPYVILGIGFAVHFLIKGKSFFDKRYWRFVLLLCLPLIFHQLSNTLLHQCDKIMLNKMTDEATVGVYGFAVTFANIINIVWLALNTTFVPFYHDDVKANDFAHLHKRTKNYLFLFSVLTVGFVYAMPEVVKVFGSNEFWGSIRVIPLLAFGLYFVFLYSFPVNFEFFHCKTKTIAVGTCLAAVFNVILNFVLIPIWGMVGAAVATVASYVLLWAFHSFFARRVVKEPYHFAFREFYWYLLAVAIAVALFYLIADLWYIRWLLCACLGVVLLLKIKKQKSIF